MKRDRFAPPPPRCQALNVKGFRCQTAAIPGEALCVNHHPDPPQPEPKAALF